MTCKFLSCLRLHIRSLNGTNGRAFAVLMPAMIVSLDQQSVRRKAVWGPKRVLTVALLLVLGYAPGAFAATPKHLATTRPGVPGHKATHNKLDKELTLRAGHNPNATTSVIVTLRNGAKLPAEFKKYARAGKLNLINGHIVDLPNRLLKQLSAHPDVFDVHYNRPIFKHNLRTSMTVGALAAQQAFGVTGAGVGVAVIDSGVTTWHDDLTNHTTASYPYGDQRVSAFVDFVNSQTLPYDDNGHGTHVSGIIAGIGFDSNGLKAGVAPDASIVSLKVLDANGAGTISNIIQALDWVVANRTTYNIRVANLSVGAGINESYWTDPLTLAAKRAVDAGVVIVAAAGNIGKDSLGQTQYGGITAPGNAPWVLTVGASSTQGTPTRGDDVMAGYSSRGPTFIDYAAKPDLVAPGTGTVSLAAPGSTFYSTKAAYLIPGSVETAFTPYLTLSGTSMAAPVVSGTVALMVQANPSLTPNAVKAILMYTAQQRSAYNALTEGAGFLNTLGAVRLASFYATAQPNQAVPVQKMWSKHIIWGNHLIKGGYLNPSANAYQLGVNWGVARTDANDNITWGSLCDGDDCDNITWGSSDEDNITWGSACNDETCDNITWGSDVAGNDANVVWGGDCGGGDCDNITWGSSTGNTTGNVVWGSSDGDNVVWGSNCDDPANCDDNIVWGSSDGDNVVWGSSATGNVVWGSSATCDPNNPQTCTDDNIVWGSDCDASDPSNPDNVSTCDDIVWGSSADGTIFWGDSAGNVYTGSPAQLQALTDGQLLKLIIKLTLTPAAMTNTPPPAPPVTEPPPDTTTSGGGI
jgi:serine protease AprX